MPAGGEEVFQDSDKMGSIAGDIIGDSQELQGIVDDFYALLNDQLGETDEGEKKAWFGNKASVFLNNIEAKHEDFNNGAKNINNLGSNLQDQADAWDAFENRG